VSGGGTTGAAEARVLAAIRARLEAVGAAWRELEHAPTRTSEESARVRGEPLAVGAKALVVKAGADFRLFVLSAARAIDSKRVKSGLGVKKLRFATPDELLERTGLVPGSVPPFGQPVLPFELLLDPSVLANDRVAFNAGSLTRSMIVPLEGYLAAAEPYTVLELAGA